MAADIKELRVSTGRRNEFIDITGQVQSAVDESGVISGICPRSRKAMVKIIAD